MQLQDTKPHSTSDFSNPMYELDPNLPSGSTSSSSAAIITPQTTTILNKPKQFEIAEVDTGKDTQNLITEAGSSEC